jgi:cytochrome c6
MKRTLLFLALTALIISCGKKEEPQTTKTQDEQQMTQTQTGQQTQTEQTQTEQQKNEQTKQDVNLKEEQKEDTKKKNDEKKKYEMKKKNNEKIKNEDKNVKKEKEEADLQKIETKNTSSEIDFAPIFAKRCAKCHGKDLKGKKDGGPDLTDTKVQNTDDSKLIKIITNGVKAKNEEDEDMPSWKNKLTEEEIKAAVKFIKAH